MNRTREHSVKLTRTKFINNGSDTCSNIVWQYYYISPKYISGLYLDTHMSSTARIVNLTRLITSHNRRYKFHLA